MNVSVARSARRRYLAALAGLLVPCVGLPTIAAARLPSAAAAAVVASAVMRPDLVDLGRAAASTPVRIAVTLAYRNKPELDRLVALQGNSRSPFFRHFLNPAQFAAAFGPSPDDYTRVAEALAGAGFRVGPTPANRTIVDAVGPASAAERFFGTEIHRFGQTGRGLRYANVKPATMPAALAAGVTSVAGLDDVVRARVESVRAAANAVEQSTPYYPNTITKVYHYPVERGFKGAGHAIAIVIDETQRIRTSRRIGHAPEFDGPAPSIAVSSINTRRRRRAARKRSTSSGRRASLRRPMCISISRPT